MNKEKTSIDSSVLSDILWMTIGTLLVSVGVYFFKFPNHFSTGGVSGLSILLGHIISFATPATMNTVINAIFLVLGFIVLNKGFGICTIYCTILYTVLTQALEWVFPLNAPLTDQKLLELFFAVILPALGAAILFKLNP